MATLLAWERKPDYSASLSRFRPTQRSTTSGKQRFGSLKGIAAATVDELASVDGMTRDVAERIKEHIGRGVGAPGA